MAIRLPSSIQTPAYVIDVAKLRANLETAAHVREASGAKVLLATKSFAMPAVFPVMAEYLDGTTASGLYEAKLAKATFAPDDASKEVHVYSPAYTDAEFAALEGVADHVYFNSAKQLARYGPAAKARGQHVALRINPGYSNATLGGELYDPCAPGSRFGEVASELAGVDWDLVDTLHAHALCESMADGSVGLIEKIAADFGEYVQKVSSVNFGGGHFLNKPGYEVAGLIGALKAFQDRFGVQAYLEPGGGLVVDAGYLVSTVVDTHRNGVDLAILDASASCHMPDVLEVPYTPRIVGAGSPGAKAHDVVLGGKTCMTGDVIGSYSFDEKLKPGDRLIFEDMAQYSFVKNNTFNGAPLPDLGVLWEDGRYELIKSFGYEDFAYRLG